MEDRSRSPPRGNVNTEAWYVLRKKLHPGAKARLKGLNVQRNGELVTLQDFYPTSGRWRVKLRSGHLKDLKPEFLVFEAPADSPPRPIHEELPIPIIQEPPKPKSEEKAKPEPATDTSSKQPDLQPGCKVSVHGLRSAMELNGQEGILDSFKSETGRWRIKLENGQMKDLKATNISALLPEKVPQDEPAEQTVSKSLLAEVAALNAELGLDAPAAEAQTQAASPTLEVKPGEKCGPGERFTVMEKLGEGDYSTVWRCKDTEHGMELAIKFTRDNPEMRFALEREVRILGDLFNSSYGKKDPEGIRSILGLAFFEGFDHKGGFGVAFEMCKCNLRTALEKYGKGRGLPLLPTVRNFGKNIFTALKILREADLIHCDVKPENLLLTRDNESVKLSDFGIAMRMSERRITDQMQPRHYRAPEVILGQEYNTQIDVWSAGATLYELATDRILFVGGTNNEMLHEMLKVCGAFPKTYLATGKFALNHFHANSDFLNAKGDMALNSPNPRVIPIARFDPPVRPIPWLLEDLKKEVPRGVAMDRHQGLVAHLIDLLGRCLLPDPASRAPPGIALAHRFFQKGA